MSHISSLVSMISSKMLFYLKIIIAVLGRHLIPLGVSIALPRLKHCNTELLLNIHCIDVSGVHASTQHV